MGGLDEISMIDVEGRHGNTRLAEDEAGTDVMSVDLNALDRIHLVRETDSPIFGEGLPQIGHHLFRPRRAVNHERRLAAAKWGLDPAAHPQIGQPVDVVRVEVGQKMGVDGPQRNLLLPETNRRPPPEVEDEPQPRDFHQRAVSVAIHRRDRAPGAEQRDGHGSAGSAVPADLTVAAATVRPGRRAAGARAPRRAAASARAAGARAPRRAATGAAGGAAARARRAALARLSAARAAANRGASILAAAGADQQQAADSDQPTRRSSKSRHRVPSPSSQKVLFQVALKQKSIVSMNLKQPGSGGRRYRRPRRSAPLARELVLEASFRVCDQPPVAFRIDERVRHRALRQAIVLGLHVVEGAMRAEEHVA